MHDGSGRIVVQNLSKNFGPVAAVQNLSFQVEPGSVTGFLGPNGSGKTTTLRMLLGLVKPTSGHATINGVTFDRLGNPARVVGGVLEAQGFHPGRTARDHLRVYAAAMGVEDSRADEVLNLVGLGVAGDRAAGGFSLGMKQRLALATALLGDPQVLVLDEPANGLDPEGIAWLRSFLKAFAQSGRTVLISSHLLAEVEQTIDQVVIISRGQTMYYGKLDDLRKSQQSRVVVHPGDPQKLTVALQEMKISNITPLPDGRLAVVGATVQQIGDIAAQAGVALYGVQEERADLEQLFFGLTSGQYSAPGQVPHGQLPPVPPGYQQGPPPGYAPQQQGWQQPQQWAPPQQGGYPQQAAPGYQQPGTPPGGYQQTQGYQHPGTPPGGYQQTQGGYQQPGTPPGGYQQPGTQQDSYQQPGTPPGGYQQPGASPDSYQPGTPAGGYQPAPVTPPAPPAPPVQQTPPGMWQPQQDSGQQWAQPQPVEQPPAPPPPATEQQRDGKQDGGAS